VGIRSAEDGRGNAVLGITAAPRQHESYARLVIERPEIGRRYEVLFGDIHQLPSSNRGFCPSSTS